MALLLAGAGPVLGTVPEASHVETGVASWYGYPFHGRTAADGEIYHMEKLTAAHRTLPFHTWVRVVNLTNAKSVRVRIIDRGPFVDGRIIDLSHAAAEAIEMVGPGTAPVRVEVLEAPHGIEGMGRFAVQVGAFRERRNAERSKEAMRARFGPARMVWVEGLGLWRVMVGSSAEVAARELAGRIGRETGMTGFVVRDDSGGP